MKAVTKKMKASAGFTLLEILVVLTIMGFLIAMVAPRLAGISSDAVDTVCDSNQNRQTTMMSAYFEKTNRMPDRLTNLVDRTGAATFQLPAISDDDPQNGAESLAAEFNERNHFRIHYLNQDEVKELKKLGITTVFNLNAYDAYDGADLKDGYRTDANEYAIANTIALNARGPFMEEFAMNASAADPEIAVAMVGFGAADANTDVTFTVGTNQAAGELPERG
jgi:prepilin-type N-terminal cleavage/methylation domain-containing protein